MIARKISFERILPIWQNELWQNRQSNIETHSAMTWPFDGNTEKFDMKVFDYDASFFGVFSKQQLIGVNSGHRTEEHVYRSRGIWVDPAFRKTGVAQTLFELLESQAREEDCNMIWSIPRKIALPAYIKFGFETVGDYFDEGMEFGPNIYVRKDLNGFN